MDDSPAPLPGTAFYTVADQRFFPGLVALLNSLRLTGHEEPLIVVDNGLSPGQRELLADHVTLVDPPSPDLPAVFLAPYGPRLRPAQVAVLIDADIIVTRPLTEITEAAGRGRIAAFVDCLPNSDRFHPEWETALGLGPLSRRPYLNAGFLAFPNDLTARLLPPWLEGQLTVGVTHSRYGRATLDDPFYFADQDVLNAVLSARFEPDELLVLDHRLAPHPPFPGLTLTDRRRLTCRYGDGAEPFLLHHVLAKPWLRATRVTLYSTLLTRLLLEPDVALPLDPSSLPLRLREGRAAALDRRRADTVTFVHDHGRRQLGRFGVRTRLARWRSRQAAH
ncbi:MULTISPECIES: hypothetical protein [unclassified Streptomyces]|uniref:hypothetical protein n=1 Tax=unclassified Streptomyces TaxID=2593676 RepID=UPI000F503258|nr:MULTISPECIES: hypothetical protein [unclassified Streptomyces]MDH6454604.1 hypothetical protein [Streptomyces sp. SAI-119]MDH6494838.1 hypothetical protein [Streptomyces sp. SAI-149]QUC58024.1 hypothetical protein IOD14_15130 [Streptomyces sp. A2-16]